MSRLNKWEAYQALKAGEIVTWKSNIEEKYYYKMIGGQIYCSGSQYFEDYTDDHRMFSNMENKFEIVEDDKEQEIKHLKTIVNFWIMNIFLRNLNACKNLLNGENLDSNNWNHDNE